MSTNRRGFLGGVFAGVTALGTGCVGSSGDSDDPTATNDESRSTTRTTTSPTTTATSTNETATTPSTTPDTPRPTETANTTADTPIRKPPACDDGVHRLSYPIDEVRYGSLGGFALTASKKTVARDETISFRLENTTDSEKVTGNKRKYDIQRRTENGWRSIYWVEAEMYTDEGIVHPPGDGFRWTVPFSRNDLEQLTQFNTPYSVCDDLVPGDYRFVYWGVGSEAERKSDHEKEYAVGVRFSVARS